MPAPRQILIVEHEAHARMALAELLRDEGFEVDTAVDGFDALGEVTRSTPEVVICDLQISGMDGSELVTRLRQRVDPPSVIAMTTFGDTASALDAMRAGARAYLTKPIRFDELAVVLGKVIEHHDLEREVAVLRDAERSTDPLEGPRAMSR